MNKKKVIFWRVYLAFFFLAILAIAIVFKIVKTQTVEGSYWRGMADSLTTRFVEVEPNRGNIYAADGSLLATSLSMYNVRLDTKADGLTTEAFMSNVDSLAFYLANFYQGEGEKSKAEWKADLLNARKNGNRYFLIRTNVDHLELKQLKKMPLFNLGRYKGGFIVEQRSIRKRPFKLLAQRTIGYDRKNAQDVGIEGGYNNYLSGTIGKRLMQKVSSKDWIPINDKNELEPENGLDIYTTIDVNIQDFAERALLKGLQLNEAEHGCAVVMEAATGKIVAIANLGKHKESYLEIFNFALGTKTQPGSTFKLAPLLALLEDGYMTPEDTIQTGNGIWEIYDQTMRDSKIGGFGTLTLREIIELSSNIGIAKAMEKHYKHQPQVFINFLHKMKLHEKTGLNIKGEPEPYIKIPGTADWFGTTLYWMAHGYELQLTPLQTLALYNVVANKGTLMKPNLVTDVKEIAETVEHFKPEILAKNIISEKTAQQATEILTGAVEHGTARNGVFSNKVSIAGKTGTAVASKKEGEKIYQSSFAGFFPAKNPKYTCIVLVYNPQAGKYYGADVAGPIFKEIAECTYSYDIDLHNNRYVEEVRNIKKRPTFIKAQVQDLKNIYANLQIDIEENENEKTEWAEPFLVGNKIVTKSKDDVSDVVPNTIGLSLSDAFYLCENKGLKIKYQGSGNVYRQVPENGTKLKKGGIIYLNLK